jgi:hypothetical protein
MNVSKRLIIVLIFTALSISLVQGQTFFKSYSMLLVSRNKIKESQRSKEIRARESASILKKVFKQVKLNSHIDMLACDTLFIVNYWSWDNGKTSELIWNKNHSCEYSSFYTYEVHYTNLEIVADADIELKKLNPEFKNIVETTDTARFLKFIQTSEHTFPKNNTVQFRVATRKGKNWHFVSSYSYATSEYHID